MKNLLSKKLFSTGGAMGAICYLASLVVSGGLTAPIGLAFAGIVGVVTAVHIITQGKIDDVKTVAGAIKPPEVPEVPAPPAIHVSHPADPDAN